MDRSHATPVFTLQALGLADGALEPLGKLLRRESSVLKRCTMLRVFRLVLVWAVSTGAVAEVSVSPGGIVRWPGAGIDRCGQVDGVWDAVGDACWYPIDLLRAPGKDCRRLEGKVRHHWRLARFLQSRDC